MARYLIVDLLGSVCFDSFEEELDSLPLAANFLLEHITNKTELNWYYMQEMETTQTDLIKTYRGGDALLWKNYYKCMEGGTDYVQDIRLH